MPLTMVLSEDYPHAFVQHRRAGSPSGIMDVANVVGFSESLEHKQPGALKRPLPERVSPNEAPEGKRVKAC